MVAVRIYRRSFIVLTACAAVLFLSGCEEKIKKRPYGFLNIGLVKDLQAPETFLRSKQIYLRHDARGYSAMSTACTYDLSPLLAQREKDGSVVFFSNYSESRYSATGQVLHGPAVGNLPYYKLKVDEGKYGGPKDTLYVEIGAEVPPDWRLPG